VEIKMELENYPDIQPLLDEILAALQAVLDDKLRGLYLTGSLVTGGFVDGTSDIDLFALLSSDLSKEEFAALDKAHLAFVAAHPEWENGIEIVYLSEAGLATFREKRSPIAVISPGEPFNLKDAGLDWAINWFVLRQHGHVLYGPPVDEVFPDISQVQFVEDVRAQVREWGDYVANTRDSLRYQSYAVITLSRALMAVMEERQPTKEEAANWVSVFYPQWAQLIGWAMATRVEEGELTDDPLEMYAQVRAFVFFVVVEIDR
jgi:predicted nucleotidyltransferase